MYEFYIMSPPLPLCIPPSPISYFTNFVKLFFLIIKAFPPNIKTLQSQEKLLKLFKLYKVILFSVPRKKNLTNFIKCVSWLMQSCQVVKFCKFSYKLITLKNFLKIHLTNFTKLFNITSSIQQLSQIE